MEGSSLTAQWNAAERAWIETFFKTKAPKVWDESTQSKDKLVCSAETCNLYAAQLLGVDDIRPVDNQGAQSYTVISPSKDQVVQFRLQRLEEHVLKLARQVYGTLVPEPVLVKGFPLPVYVCAAIHGIIHIYQSFPSATEAFPLERQLKTVRDMAGFIARSAYWPQPRSDLSLSSWTCVAEAKLKNLAQRQCLLRMEPRFTDKIAQLRSQLHLLEKLPLVLTHLDLAEINIMVDPLSGHVTGVVDFDGARVEAFGMCIFGVYESFLGVMQDARWKFFDQPIARGDADVEASAPATTTVRQVLETAFWDTLWSSMPPHMRREELQSAVDVALEMGMINRYLNQDRDVDPEDSDDARSVNWAVGLLLDR